MPSANRWGRLKTRIADRFDLVSPRFQDSYEMLEQRLADRTRELEAVNAISGVVSQSLDLKEVLDGALEETLGLMDVEAGGIYLLDENLGKLNIAAQRGFDPELLAEIDGLALGEGFSGRVAQSGEPLIVRDVPTDARLTRLAMRDQRYGSLVSVPLCSKRQVLGTLFVMSGGIREFGEQDVAILVSIGHQIGMAVESARLFHAVQHS